MQAELDKLHAEELQELSGVSDSCPIKMCVNQCSWMCMLYMILANSEGHEVGPSGEMMFSFC